MGNAHLENCPSKSGKKLTAVKRVTHQGKNAFCFQFISFDRVGKRGQRVFDLVQSGGSKKNGDSPANGKHCKSDEGCQFEEFNPRT